MQEKLLKDYEQELKGSGQGSKHAKKVPTGSALFSSYHQDTAFHTFSDGSTEPTLFFPHFDLDLSGKGPTEGAVLEVRFRLNLNVHSIPQKSLVSLITGSIYRCNVQYMDMVLRITFAYEPMIE